MKKKALLSIGLSLSMVLVMGTPVFAANTDKNVNADGTEVTAPGTPDYNSTGGGKTQTAGQSYNEANITSTDANSWVTVNDDDKLAGALDLNGADINVWGKVLDAKETVYKVDLAWGSMKFEYNSLNSTKWNTESHQYDKGSATAQWTPTYLDGVNNKVAVTNHSNYGINAGFAYKMEGTKFNYANGENNVIGNFFDTKEKATTAASVLKGTYDAVGNVNDLAVANKLAGSKVALATADAYNDGTNNVPVGARIKDVFFAFSGTPDEGKGKDLNDFKKVGVITVTVTPNGDPTLN